MILFFNSVVLLLVAGLVTIVDFALERVILNTVYNWIGLNPSSPWWWSFLVYGIIYVASFEFLLLVFSGWEVRLAYRNKNALYSLLHNLYGYIGSRGQWWGLYILAPLTFLHTLDVILVAANRLSPEVWWVIFIGIVSLWGVYLFGEPVQARKKSDLPPVKEPSQEEELSSGTQVLSTTEFVKRLRNATWYYGQICYQLTPSMPDPSPITPIEIHRPYQKIRNLCESQKPAYASDAEVEEMFKDNLIREIVQNLVNTEDPQPRLYKHQVDTLRLLGKAEQFDEKGNPLHVILSTPIGSGRKTVALIAALKRVLLDHQSLIIIFPDRFTGIPQAEILKNALQKTPWEWAINIQEFWGLPEDRTTMEWTQERYCPDILFTSVEFLHQYLLPNHVRFQYFFQQLGLMIVENLDEYTGVFALNASYVFGRLQRLLNHYDSSPQILALAQASTEAADHFQRLFRTSLPPNGRIIINDGRGTLPKTFLIWNPPLLREKGDDPSSPRFEIARKNVFTEIRQIVAELISSGYKPAILSRDVPITDSDVSDFYNRLTDLLTTGGYMEGFDIPIGRSFRHMFTRTGKIARDNPADYSACIVVGNINSWPAIQHEIYHLGENLSAQVDQPLVIYVTPDTPYAQFSARNPIQFLAQIKDFSPVESRPTTSNPRLAEKFIFYAAAELPIGLKEARKFFGEEGVKALRQLGAANQLRYQDRNIWDQNEKKPVIERFFSCDLPINVTNDLHSVENELWEAIPGERPDHQLGLIDRYLLPQVAYKNAILSFEGQRYRVLEINPEEKQISLGAEMHAAHTEVILNTRLMLNTDRKNIVVRKQNLDRSGGFQVAICRSGVDISITQVGFRTFRDFGFENFQQENLLNASAEPAESSAALPLNCSFFSSNALTIGFDNKDIKPGVLHAMGHLLKIVLPFFLSNSPSEIGILELDSCEWLDGKPAIAIYENVPGGNGVAEWVENNLGQILDRAYEILVQCPCSDGCPGCLKIPTCSHITLNDDLDKVGTIQFLGSLLGKTSQDTIQFRTIAMDTAESAEFHRWQIIEQVLLHRFGLTIGEPANFTVEINAEKKGWPENIVGYYFPAQNLVSVRPQKEQDMIATLAHEYAHNWQFQGSPQKMSPQLMDAAVVPYFDGRLLIEGFAQWIEFKAADHFGFRQTARNIVFRHCDEYREGFEILKWLEESSRGGSNRVIQFITAGQVVLGNTTYGLEELITAAKMKQRIADAEARLVSKPDNDIQTEKNPPPPPETGEGSPPSPVENLNN